jgi:hypothetical protein
MFCDTNLFLTVKHNSIPLGYFLIFFIFLNGSTAAWSQDRLSFRGFTFTLFRHTTLGRITLYEGPAPRRDLYLTTHNNHNRQTSMPPSGFEPTILVTERPQTHALDRTATGIGTDLYCFLKIF